MISKKKILLIVIVVVVVVVAVVGIYLWQSLTAGFAEVEETIEAYLDAVNSYDASAAWALMSSAMQADVTGGYPEFENLMQTLEQSGWQAEIESITSKSIETKDGKTTATFTLTATVTETGVSPYTETWTFELVKIEGQWKIDDWITVE